MPLPVSQSNVFAVSVADRGLWRQKKLLEAFLGGPVVRDFAPLRAKNAVRIGWGRKASGLRAERIGMRAGQAVWRLEDGFLRSWNLGHVDPPLSLVVDDVGIYYDCHRPSRLERLLSSPLAPEQSAQAVEIIRAWRNSRVSKYNFQPDYAGSLPENFVLVVDQTLNDHSIRFGAGDGSSFERMLKSAIRDYPGHTILVKTHPDVMAGRKAGYFDADVAKISPRVRLFAEAVHPARLIAEADAIYTVTSQLGFEALLWGKPVHTFGMPFYAGWGLTEDDQSPPTRRGRATLEALAHSALIEYPLYCTPSGEPTTFWETVHRLSRQSPA
ncbi:hypothetical protein GR183_19950 [Stappia sp. GBMRC 2046]|uniref:Capsular polysaccharide export protein n=1 Tax=Stappia sediminis TaxID=2692190 RepID=A0A7X3LXV9_9HYPH|nr:hypothetical protein [Stappia sediminis]MXN67189.1 hypothetical protein [Stappia sediminis]